MDNKDLYGQNNQQAQGPQGIPSSPTVNVRTAESDVSSLMKSGGQAPTPQKVVLPPSMPDPNVNFSGFANPESNAPVPPRSTMPGSAVQPAPRPPKKHSALIWIIALMVIVVLAGVGYFVFANLLSGSKPAATPAAQTGFPSLPPIAPTSSAPSPTTSTSTAVSAPLFTSFFTVPPTAQLSVSYATSTGIGGLKVALNNALPINATSGFYEVLVSNKNTSQLLSVADLIPYMISAYSSNFVISSFQSQPDLFIYQDSKGIWPGVVLELNASTTTSSVKTTVAKIESADLSAFYMVSPGTFGAFKNGTIGTYTERYALSSNGSAFDYGFFGKYLILSSSYDGIKAAVSHLGL